MDEIDSPRVQMNGSVVIGSPRPVLDVTFNGATEARKGYSDLMVASRFGMHFHKGVLVRFADHLVFQFRLFPFATRLVESEALVEFVVFGQIIHDMPFGFIGGRFDNGPIRFLHFSQAKHVGEAG